MADKDTVCEMADRFLEIASFQIGALDSVRKEAEGKHLEEGTLLELRAILREGGAALGRFCAEPVPEETTFTPARISEIERELECNQKTVPQLRDMCKSKGVKGYWNMAKFELIEKCCL